MAARKRAAPPTPAAPTVAITVSPDGTHVLHTQPDSEAAKLEALIPDVVGKEQRVSVILQIINTRLSAENRKAQIAELTIIDEDTYKTADLLREASRVSGEAARDVFGPTIKPIREGLDKLYALQREIVIPWTECVEYINTKMKDYKRLEKAENDKRVAAFVETQRIAQAQLDAELAEQARLNPPTVTPVIPVAITDPTAWVNPHTAAPIARVMHTPVPAPVQADNSFTKYKDVVKVTDKDALFCEIMNETAPLDLLVVDDAALQFWFQTNPEAARKCAGIKIVSEPTISSRGRR